MKASATVSAQPSAALGVRLSRIERRLDAIEQRLQRLTADKGLAHEVATNSGVVQALTRAVEELTAALRRPRP
jgi:hypothetical protein